MTERTDSDSVDDSVTQTKTTSDLKAQFDNDGYLLLRQCVVSTSVADEWIGYSQKLIKAVFASLHERGHTTFAAPYRIGAGEEIIEYPMQPGVKCGFREIVMRSPGRYEISILHSSVAVNQPFPSLHSLQESLGFVPSLLDCCSWNEVQLLNLSLVMSTPGAPEQTWHADGGHVSIQEHLPCHCLNVFIPLTAVTMENGPTELRPGTHYLTRNLASMMLAAKARHTLRETVVPHLCVGDLLLFDYRLLHHGRSNRSGSERTILVLTVAKPWFKDVLNFPSKRLLSD